MSKTTIIVDKYAKAAFEIAKDNNLCDVFVKDLGIFYQNIAPNIKELSNPTISKSQMAEIVSDIGNKLAINPLVLSFLMVVSKARRLSSLGRIHCELEHLVKAENNILQVELISAQKLSEDQISQTKKILAANYPQKTIEISESIKEEILGGVVIKIGSFVIDNSIKSQLSNIYAECHSVI